MRYPRALPRGDGFIIEEVGELFPAYISQNSKIPSIVVKFPTFKIDVYGVVSKDNNGLDEVGVVHNILDELEEANSRVACCAAVNHMLDLNSKRTWDEQVVQIKCMDFGLSNNIKLRDDIRKLFDNKGYLTGQSIDTNYIYSEIDLLDGKKQFGLK